MIDWCSCVKRLTWWVTGSVADSWQRCTRLLKVLLSIMCSAGISFCSTRSAGSWRKDWNTHTSIIYCEHPSWHDTSVWSAVLSPVCWAPEGLRAAPELYPELQELLQENPWQEPWWEREECSSLGAETHSHKHSQHLWLLFIYTTFSRNYYTDINKQRKSPSVSVKLRVQLEGHSIRPEHLRERERTYSVMLNVDLYDVE